MASTKPDPPYGTRVERWLNVAGTIVAPATLVSALLFYFGYVSARAQYRYFGIDVDTVGLSTRDYVMRSPQPLLVPLLALSLLGAGLLVLHNAVGSRADSMPASRVGWLARLLQISVIAGAAVLGSGILLLFSYGYLREWPFYNLVTPLLFATGSTATAYAVRARRLLRLPQPAGDADQAALVRRSAGVLVWVVVAASLFWATATVAQWSGRGLARYDAQHLDRMPSVILDTKERLFLRSPGIEETVLPAAPDQTFHYRYRRLRLLIQGHDRMFLIPDIWSASNSTLVVPLDESVRVQFQFQNSPP